MYVSFDENFTKPPIILNNDDDIVDNMNDTPMIDASQGDNL